MVKSVVDRIDRSVSRHRFRLGRLALGAGATGVTLLVLAVVLDVRALALVGVAMLFGAWVVFAVVARHVSEPPGSGWPGNIGD